ncbi:MAG: hypothetical protein WBQ14_05715 [Gaiellaceae bacterium]
MKSTTTPRARFLAVLALILLAGGGSYLLISGSSSNNDTAGTQATLQHSTTSTQARTIAKKIAGSEKSKKKRAATPVDVVNTLDAALATHPLVVISVYARNVATDEQAMEEAKAGAAEADAGFIAFNAFDEKIARQLAGLLGSNTASTPEVLIYKRGRKLVFTLEGFADSQVVAQAARNAYPYSEPWVNDANRICTRFSVALADAQGKEKIANLTTAAGRRQAAAALDKAANLLTQETKSLDAVRANMSDAAEFAQLVADLRQIATNMGSEAVALRSNDRETAGSLEQKRATLIASASSLAANLQISSCAS